MRDFNNAGEINVQGNFNVTDNSHNAHKLLIQCSIDELLRERPFRQENIQLEQARKVKRLRPFYALTLILAISTATWATLNGKTDLATIIMSGATLFLGYQSLKATLEPNAFQIEERNAVNEINKILKQRRFE
ncbi:hypothetical protein [Chromobacterium aquaticum]|uniref:SMODS and SLOG-associating 2TM effector domain-containing protein n=1 Tax=Chromobacterium aquaticum TaxID=467180 RepID=A0ABV8ZT82_9NEIS|nr:hypothetical protein [Chromobacterium aquaticum]MCD5364650.1 hypothetical protein [Chromobacterium aquaticum]